LPGRNIGEVQLFPDQYSTVRKAETIATMLARLRQLPGVRAAGFSRHGVLIREELTIGTFVPLGRALDEMRSDPQKPRVRSVSDGFLTAMGVPLLDGRELETGDVANAAPVIVINRSAGRRFFGSARAVGQVVNWYVGDAPVQMTVVGVVEDVRQESLGQETFPEIYVDYRQFLSLLERWPEYARHQNGWAIGFLSFAIRTGSTPESVIPSIRRLTGAVDPNIAIDALVPMTRLVAGSLARQRFSAVMLGAFAGVAGVLAAIGIYGLLAFSWFSARRKSASEWPSAPSVRKCWSWYFGRPDANHHRHHTRADRRDRGHAGSSGNAVRDYATRPKDVPRRRRNVRPCDDVRVVRTGTVGDESRANGRTKKRVRV
jgi:putative ABC transport system permease protein